MGGHWPIASYPFQSESLYLSLVREPISRAVSLFSYYVRPEYAADRTLEARARKLQRERWLDKGMGSCVLGNAKMRDIVSESLSSLNDEQYQLDAYVIMPNHVHFIIRPLHGYELTKILQTLKRISSFKINKILQKQGALWQGESYDRIIRDSQHLWRCLQYIGGNPGKAKLQKNEFTRWINPAWPPLGWIYRNE